MNESNQAARLCVISSEQLAEDIAFRCDCAAFLAANGPDFERAAWAIKRNTYREAWKLARSRKIFEPSDDLMRSFQAMGRDFEGCDLAVQEVVTDIMALVRKLEFWI